MLAQFACNACLEVLLKEVLQQLIELSALFVLIEGEVKDREHLPHKEHEGFFETTLIISLYVVDDKLDLIFEQGAHVE